jgi:hypothetical protein
VIPEASTPSRKRKRRAQLADEHSLDRAEQMKSVRNLDFAFEKCNNSDTQTSFVQFFNSIVIENLQSIGISLGGSDDQIYSTVERMQEVELERTAMASSKNLISEVFDKDEKEELDNEEIDKLILNSWCGEIMDEVMDMGNAYPKDCKFTPRQQTPSSSKKLRSKGVRQNTSGTQPPILSDGDVGILAHVHLKTQS